VPQGREFDLHHRKAPLSRYDSLPTDFSKSAQA
jgi:hypothetical protein